MKRILLVCGSGICTSTAVNQKVSKALDERGLKGQYKITQGKASASHPIMTCAYPPLSWAGNATAR